MRDAVIVEAVRTPIGKGKPGGALHGVHPVELLAGTIRELIERTGIEPALVDDVIGGTVSQVGEQSYNTTRWAALSAGLPESVPATTVDRQCGSSQQAVHFAAQGVISGAYDIVIAGGVESMSRVPLGAARTIGQPYGPKVQERYDHFEFNQGTGAELISQKWGLSRHDLDSFSARSHARAAAAIDSGAFSDQIVPVTLEDGTVFDTDEGLRRGTTPESLAKLKTSFKEDGVIHAGNASQISDGAAALLVTTPEKARELGLTPIAKYRAGAVSGADPIMMLTGPIPATEKLLARTGLSIHDVGAYEVNEAFAPVPMAWSIELGATSDAAQERLNPLGGAIAVGHPLGASGAILMTRMVHHMRANNIRYGLQTMCEGGGTANATLVELAG